MKLQLCDFSYRDYFHSMLHLIKCHISHLQATSAGPKYSRLLTQPPEQPHPTAAGKLWSITRFWNLPQLLLHGKPRFLQGRTSGISESPQINGKVSFCQKLEKLSHRSSVLPALHLRKALQCCAKYASWVFWCWPFKAVIFPGEILGKWSGSCNMLWFFSHLLLGMDTHLPEMIITFKNK